MCRNEILRGKLPEHQSDRNMKGIHKNIWPEKSSRQNAKNISHEKASNSIFFVPRFCFYVALIRVFKA